MREVLGGAVPVFTALATTDLVPAAASLRSAPVLSGTLALALGRIELVRGDRPLPSLGAAVRLPLVLACLLSVCAF